MDTAVKKPIPPEKREKCLLCGWDPQKRVEAKLSPGLFRDWPEHVRIVADYIDNNITTTKTIEAIWRPCCGILDRYIVKLESEHFKKY